MIVGSKVLTSTGGSAMGIDRATVIGLMRGAFRRGQSANSFLRDMKAEGFKLRRTDALADWRSINELETKKDLMQYVRKDYYPSKAVTAQVSWDLTQEYMYVVKVKSRREPGVPVTERNVNITSDIPMTPRMVEQAVVEKWAEWEEYGAEPIEEIIPWAAVHKVIE